MLTRFLSAICIVLILIGCNKVDEGKSSPATPGAYTTGGLATSSSGGSGNGDSTEQYDPGLITAGEWNDLSNWDFWTTISAKDEYDTLLPSWHFYTSNRISVSLTDSKLQPISDAVVKLKQNGSVIFTSHTDNFGKAELWLNLFTSGQSINYTTLSLDVNNGAIISKHVIPYSEGINSITTTAKIASQYINIAFVTDATGSMSDELEFLKSDLLDVITKAKNDNPGTNFSTASVFYRDEGDDYITKTSAFTTNANTTINFIKDQRADGGGDFPEAVHSALDKAVNGLQWSETAKTRLLFLLLDAPPHKEDVVINSLQKSLTKAAEKGIKIIPVTASGIDKETEFVMRFFAESTNGTYVFITNDSGIGNDHLTPTVGPYDVEFLNNLMVRLIDKYAK